MELIQPMQIQRLHQKRVNKARRIQSAIETGVSPLIEAEKGVVLECARELSVNEEAMLLDVLTSIIMEGGYDPVTTAIVLALCLQELKGKVEYHWKSKEAEAQAKEMYSQQLEYLALKHRFRRE